VKKSELSIRAIYLVRSHKTFNSMPLNMQVKEQREGAVGLPYSSC
jgi:hypothetical protein